MYIMITSTLVPSTYHPIDKFIHTLNATYTGFKKFYV